MLSQCMVVTVESSSKSQLKKPQIFIKPVFMCCFFKRHRKGSRKGLRPVPQTFSMIFKKFSKTAQKLLVYETLVRGSPLKNDGYETICFVKLTIDISIWRNSSSLRIFVINSLPHLLIAFFSSSSIVLFEMILLKCQICKVNRSMTKSVKSTD